MATRLLVGTFQYFLYQKFETVATVLLVWLQPITASLHTERLNAFFPSKSLSSCKVPSIYTDHGQFRRDEYFGQLESLEIARLCTCDCWFPLCGFERSRNCANCDLSVYCQLSLASTNFDLCSCQYDPRRWETNSPSTKLSDRLWRRPQMQVGVEIAPRNRRRVKSSMWFLVQLRNTANTKKEILLTRKKNYC